MAARVRVIPDADGVIRLRCGDADLELEIVAAPPGSPAAPAPPPSPPPPPTSGGGGQGLGDKPVIAFRLIGADSPNPSLLRLDAGTSLFAAEDIRLIHEIRLATSGASQTVPPVVSISAQNFDVHFFDNLMKALDENGDPLIVEADLSRKLP